MAKKLKSKSEAPVSVAPCFNCGVQSGFVYDPEKDNVPSEAFAQFNCQECRCNGPKAKTVKEAIFAWNNLYVMSQTAKAYNAIAQVENPMQFASFMQGLLVELKAIDASKLSIQQQAANEALADRLREMVNAWDKAAVVIGGLSSSIANATNATVDLSNAFVGKYDTDAGTLTWTQTASTKDGSWAIKRTK